ncbi:hypothetical protein [Sphaerisporangium rhizosphaerae]|uniref:Helix-turn-helix domain-containing protein n=1 Tax=Sphaerisporangium rhizosphaerae TaxID=2269375 RepID=A0ABW2NUI0_9ACTN
MTRIADGDVKDTFAQVPEHYVFSDFISDRGLQVIAFLFSVKYTTKTGELLCNAMPAETIAKALHTSASSVKRELADLKKLGIIKTTKTRQGNTFQITILHIDGDTFRGRNMRPSQRFARVQYSVITSGVSPEALRLWMILARIGGPRAWFGVFQETLAGYLKVSDRHIRNLISELKALGLLEFKRHDKFGSNDYKLYEHLNGFFLIHGFPGEVYELSTETSCEDADLSVDTEPTAEVIRHAAWEAVSWWVNGVLGGGAWVWSKQNKDRAERLTDYVFGLMKNFGVERVTDTVEQLSEEYGSGCEPEFLFKLLDDHYGLTIPPDNFDYETKQQRMVPTTLQSPGYILNLKAAGRLRST